MVNPAKVEGLAYTLRQYLVHLKNLGIEGKDIILADPYKRGAARYYLQVSIECCIDIGNHVIASEQFGAPTTHRETFQILSRAGLRLRTKTGFAPNNPTANFSFGLLVGSIPSTLMKVHKAGSNLRM